MPFKKTRNSRDDKSTKFNKSARTGVPSDRDQSESSDGTNSPRKKLFGGQTGRSFKPSSERSTSRTEQSKSYGEKKPFDKRRTFDGEKKPYGSKSQGERKPYDRENRFDKKPAGERKPYGRSTGAEKSAFSKPPGSRKTYSEKFGESRPERKPYGERSSEGRPETKPYSERSGEGRPERKPYGERSGENRPERKPYSERSGEGRPERKPYSERSGESRPERKPYGERSGENRPERKPYGERSGESRPERKPYGERSNESRPERKPYGERSNEGRPEKRPYTDKPYGDKKSIKSNSEDNFRPYDRESKYRSDDRKWSSEEKLKTVNRSKKPVTAKDDSQIRLNRFIANAGICSRRKADELIAAGVVSVNGVAVTELGFKVDPSKDLVRYNGEALKREKMVYVLLNKPKDFITTTDDPQERKTVMNLVEKAAQVRIYPVGRLDRNTTGLLLMTNDGDLAEKLSHPRNNVTKIYQVELNRNVPQGDLNKIAFGLELEDGLIKPDQVSYVTGGSKNEIGIQIHSGKNRIVRRIFEHLGYEVVKLDRVVYSSLTKKDLPRGHWRYLEDKEIIQLKHLIK